MKKQQLVWVNILKTIAILAVVLGHMPTPFTPYIFAFHMPLFFFVSGFFLQYKQSFWQELWHDTKRYMRLFFVFAILGLGVEYIKRFAFPNYAFITPTIDVYSEIFGIFYYMDFAHMHQYGFVLWFLPALVFGRAITRMLSKIPFGWAMVIASSLLALGVFGPPLPFALGSAFIGVFWIVLGMKVFPKLTKMNGSLWMFLTSLAGIIILFQLPLYGLDIAKRIVVQPVYTVLWSTLFILFLVGIVQFLSKFRIVWNVQVFGQNTMMIFLIHPYVNNAAYLITTKWFYGIWIWEFLIAIIGITAAILVLNMVKKRYL